MRLEITLLEQPSKHMVTVKTIQQKQQMEQTYQPTAGKITSHAPTFEEIIVAATTRGTQQPNIISQEEDSQAEAYAHPADNTQAKAATRMLTWECTLSTIRIPHITWQQSIHITREIAGATVDGEKGGLLEYHHLSTHPKYKETWKHSYRKEIWRLAQGMMGQVNGTNIKRFL